LFGTVKSSQEKQWIALVSIAAALASGEISSVVVWRLDRLGRTAKGLTAFFEDLTGAKVNLLSLKESIFRRQQAD
jgi:DNA invertase Pin-like site-specific DNA recombinase